MSYIGVDPGTQGALCHLDAVDGSTEFFDTPNDKKGITPLAVALWLRQQRPTVRVIGLEDVHSIFGANAKSNFQFGRNVGLIEAVLKCSGMDITWAQPKAWQKGCGITFVYPEGSTPAQRLRIRKQTVAERCLDLYPEAQIHGPKGGLKDGRADALMIAHYMSITHTE